MTAYAHAGASIVAPTQAARSADTNLLTRRHAQRPASDPSEELAALQDHLYDLIVTRIAQSRPPGELRRLRRDTHEAAGARRRRPAHRRRKLTPGVSRTRQAAGPPGPIHEHEPLSLAPERRGRAHADLDARRELLARSDQIRHSSQQLRSRTSRYRPPRQHVARNHHPASVEPIADRRRTLERPQIHHQLPRTSPRPVRCAPDHGCRPRLRPRTPTPLAARHAHAAAAPTLASTADHRIRRRDRPRSRHPAGHRQGALHARALPRAPRHPVARHAAQRRLERHGGRHDSTADRRVAARRDRAAARRARRRAGRRHQLRHMQATVRHAQAPPQTATSRPAT